MVNAMRSVSRFSRWPNSGEHTRLACRF
jgi:hypothetical protein